MNIANQVMQDGLMSRLKQATSSEHHRIEIVMQRLAVFASQENYAQFTLVQYYFQKEIEYLYLDPSVQRLITDWKLRGRSRAARDDLADLNLIPQQQMLATSTVSYPYSLGWIYVSEGSTLGAAFLLKQAQKKLGFSADFAARNLAAYSHGRAVMWQRFKQALDQAYFNGQQKDQIIQGALQGFKRFTDLLENFKNLK